MAVYRSVGRRIGVKRDGVRDAAKRQVERTADEPILSAMVKTAIEENLDTAADQASAPVTWMDVEQGARTERDVHRDGFRYDYDDNM